MDIKTKKKFLFIAIIAVVAVIILVRTTGNIQKAIFKKKSGLSDRVPAMTFEEDIPSVKAFMVKRMDFKDTLPVIGNIKGFKEIDIRFQAQGIIESINFEEGEKIQEGDIIASLVQKDALLKLKYAEVELTKNKRLFEIGAIAPLKLDQAKLEYESAKSDLDKTNIYAMFNGFMGAKTLDVGSYVNPSTSDKVGTFIVMNKVYAEFNIIEKDMPNVLLGQKVDIFADAYPNKSFSGTVDRISPTIEGRSRTMTVKVELDNKDNILKPGLFVRALIYTYNKKDAIVVPTSAMRKKEAEIFVYVITKEEPRQEVIEEKPKETKSGFFGFGGKKKAEFKKQPIDKGKETQFGVIEIRKIKMGHTTADLMEVDAGLEEGELVAIEVQEDFKDKARVEISEVQEGVI
ncbi:MAG: efflux RND transporter periplasmic adaptor subunit [Candidatus Omnitrophica bacterium]|nr:efflux RND transporter periplasmic adaptor subunit [Candidatus Omnitrophota bacterium]